MLNCKQTSQLVSQSLDRRLTLQERFAVKEHLLICKYCRRFSRQLMAMRVGLKRMTQSVEENTSLHMSSESKARIAKALESEIKRQMMTTLLSTLNLTKKENIMKSNTTLLVAGAIALSMGAVSLQAGENPFAIQSLSSGYQVADHHEKGKDGKCGEGKCGAEMKDKEGKCGEKMKDGKCGAESKMKDGKCGEGKCGAEMKKDK